jgi:hypothetical protein
MRRRRKSRRKRRRKRRRRKTRQTRQTVKRPRKGEEVLLVQSLKAWVALAVTKVVGRRGRR